MSRVKTLWIREPYLAHILSGLKTVEVRVGYDNIRRLQPGDRLRLNDEHPATIRRIGRYADFQDLLAHEDPAAIAPDLPPDELLAALRQVYPADKEALGAVALELALARRYDAILFDLGYTLIHFEPQQKIIIQEALRAAGAERSTVEIEAAIQAGWSAYYRDMATATFPATEEYDRQTQESLQRALLAHLGLDGEAVSTAYAAALESRFSRPGVLRPYPEVTEVLDRLCAEGYRLGIVSNWSWNLRQRVAQVGLDGYMELVWGSAYAGCHKPHPGVFRQALEQMSLSPGQVLYVGDSYPHDVVGARNAGLDAVLVDRNGTTGTPDCPVIGDLRGLFDLLAAS
jgi:HAD superfamily hydrolase (TIGR01662 family)